MTDLDVVIQKLESIKEVQEAQGKEIKGLSKGFTILAVQSEQISNLQTQTSTLWKEMNDVQKFQASCPRDSLNTFKQDIKDIANRQWVAAGLVITVVLGFAAWVKFGG
jgi:uncharacterized phage infection (PIP) family protein YhgE